MQVTHETSQLAIFDDVLPPEPFHAFWAMFCNAEFQSVHAQGVSGYYRPSDGSPYVGPNIAWTTRPMETLLPQGVSVDDLPVRLYPTGEPYDAVVQCVERALSERPSLVGQRDADWIGALGRLIAYPQGTGISWHTDDTDVTGSFIYYANPTWDVQWGGELLVADAGSRHVLTRETTRHSFDTDFETEALMRHGFGTYIMPRPNRLVIVGDGNARKVMRVADSAGDHVRATFSAFFVKPAGIKRLLGAG